MYRQTVVTAASDMIMPFNWAKYNELTNNLFVVRYYPQSLCVYDNIILIGVTNEYACNARRAFK